MKLRLSPKMPVVIFAVSVIIGGSLGFHAQVAPADEAPFLTENAAAMDKMMVDMTVTPTGDVDADFAAMMIPHHQGAIDMALAELRHGKNEQLRRIAQEIVVEQQQEIIAMRLALGQPLPPSLATFRRKIDVSGIEVSWLPQNKARRGERRARVGLD